MRSRTLASSVCLSVLAFTAVARAAPASAAPELDPNQLASGVGLAIAVLLLVSHRRSRPKAQP